MNIAKTTKRLGAAVGLSAAAVGVVGPAAQASPAWLTKPVISTTQTTYLNGPQYEDNTTHSVYIDIETKKYDQAFRVTVEQNMGNSYVTLNSFWVHTTDSTKRWDFQLNDRKNASASNIRYKIEPRVGMFSSWENKPTVATYFSTN